MFQGKCAIVTGGSSGIGLATAELLAKRGAHVGIVARDAGRLEAAREAIAAGAAAGVRVEAISADLTDWDQAKAAIDELVARGLTPDILVNSAGIILPGRFEEMPLEFFTRNMDNGFYSIVHTTRAVVPHMIAAGSGKIVNVSSMVGIIGMYGYTGYAAAKFAVMGFSESLRYEMKPHGISVHVLCPSDTDTPGLAYEKTLRPAETDALAASVKPIQPSQAAREIVRGLERNRFLIIPDFESKAGYWLKMLWPGLLFRIWDSQVAKTQRLAREAES